MTANRYLLVAIVAACAATHAAHAQRPAIDLLITGASVIDVQTGQVLPRRSIAIRGDTVMDMGDATVAARYRARRTINATGKFVIPGLWDMHVHFGGGAALINENRALMPLYIAHGIVAVRDAAGDLSGSVLAWRDSIAKGQLEGPTIFTSGPKIEGINSIWPGDTEVETTAGVDSALDALQAMQVDFVKLTDNTLKPELFRYALGAIRRRGMRSSAHIPQAVPVRDAVMAGLSSIEHLSYAVRAGTEVPGRAPATDMIAAFDSAQAMDTYRLMAEHGTAITPTLNISRVLAWLDSESHANDDYLKYIGPGLRATYQWRVDRAAGADAIAIARRHKMFEFTTSRLPMLQAAGVTILAGTDAGFLNSFDYPGLGLHDELRLMVQAGLTPLHALQAATLNGARFLGQTPRHGSVTVGGAADLLVLDRNPLLDIRATRAIAAVILRGRYLSRAVLDAMLRETAQEVARMPVPRP